LFPLLYLSNASVEAAEGYDKYGAEMYTGVQFDTEGQWFGYLGFGIDRLIDDHWSLTAKIFGSYLQYEYDSDSLAVEAKAPGVKLMVGTKYSDTGFLLILSGGVDYRDTSLTPDDITSSVSGSKTGAVFDALFIKDLSQEIVLELLGSFSTIGDSLWGRQRFKHIIPSLSGESKNRKVYIGFETVGEGNSDYSGFKVGPLFEIQNITKKFSVLFNAGYKTSDSISDAGYFGIEFYHRF
jgi:hypothetical protein